MSTAALVDDVLDLSQVDSGQMALVRGVDRFPDVISLCIPVKPLFAAKGLALETHVPSDLPSMYCDRTRIRQVLLNLLQCWPFH